MSNKFQPESQALVSYSLMGPESGGPCLVDSNQNRITRIRPYAYDKAYTDVHCNPWKIEARGQTFTPPDRVTITPLGLGYKSRVYSPNRVKYPLKRVDWDPKGERNPQNRGKSKYVRISWDEAAQICADELKRMKETYGPEAVLCESDMHGEGKRVALMDYGVKHNIIRSLTQPAAGPHGGVHPPDAQHGLLGGVVLGGQARVGVRAGG